MLRLLRNEHKGERERMVCRAFLRSIGMTFVDSEIVESRTEPVDVAFRDARFQIRERLDPGRQRMDEWTRDLIHRKQARSIDDVTEPVRLRQPMTLAELVSAVTSALEKKAARYGRAQCSKLDALAYMNSGTRFLYPTEGPADLGGLEAQGWRSVSVIFPPYGVVLLAGADAPTFLRERGGQVLMKWTSPEGLFDA